MKCCFRKIPCISGRCSLLPARALGLPEAARLGRAARGGVVSRAPRSAPSTSQLVSHSFLIVLVLQVGLLRFFQIFQIVIVPGPILATAVQELLKTI